MQFFLNKIYIRLLNEERHKKILIIFIHRFPATPAYPCSDTFFCCYDEWRRGRNDDHKFEQLLRQGTHKFRPISADRRSLSFCFQAKFCKYKVETNDESWRRHKTSLTKLPIVENWWNSLFARRFSSSSCYNFKPS